MTSKYSNHQNVSGLTHVDCRKTVEFEERLLGGFSKRAWGDNLLYLIPEFLRAAHDLLLVSSKQLVRTEILWVLCGSSEKLRPALGKPAFPKLQG